MSIFRNVLRVAARHPLYLAIYVVFMSLMGVFAAHSFVSSGGPGAQAAYDAYDAAVAVVDRDGSELSRALAEHLGEGYTLMDVADEPFALQDALAKDLVDCIVIVPEGFGEELLAAARGGTEAELPEIQLANGTAPQVGALVATKAERWASLAASAAALGPTVSAADVAARADDAASTTVEPEVLAVAAGGSSAEALTEYFSFSVYTLTCSIVVVVGCVFGAFRRRPLRLRAGAAPVPPRAGALAQLAGCAVFAAGVCAWVCALGLAVFSGEAAGVDAGALALVCLTMFVYALVPLAIAFLLAQLGLGEEGLNACGNILGMAMSFFGGAWMPIDLLGDEVQAAARLSPVYWATDAIAQLLDGAASTSGVAADLVITLLFAAAIASVGLALTHARRLQSA